MYNELVADFREKELSFPKATAKSDGQYFIQVKFKHGKLLIKVHYKNILKYMAKIINFVIFSSMTADWTNSKLNIWHNALHCAYIYIYIGCGIVGRCALNFAYIPIASSPFSMHFSDTQNLTLKIFPAP